LTSSNRRRTPKEIVYAVVKSAYEGERKTKIMYNAGLNLSQLNVYIEKLLELGMLSLDDRRRYTTTEKGKRFVKAYERFTETMDLLIEQERDINELWAVTSRHLRSESLELRAPSPRADQ
jgi:predicted transcriptional regulator